MYAALKNEKLISAQIAAKKSNQQGYICPQCKKNVQLICGVNKIPYFRHEIVEFRSKETLEHLYGKKILKSALAALNIDARLEVPIAKDLLRADVLILLEDRKYSLEFQCAPLSSQEFSERHRLYKKAQIKDIWISGKRHFLNENIKQIQLEFLLHNKFWGDFLLEINIEKNKILLKYNIFQKDLSRKVSYQVKTFEFDENGIKELLLFRPILRQKPNYKIEFEKEYLSRQIKQKSKLGMQVAEICYNKRISIDEINDSYYVGWRRPGEKIYLIEKLIEAK